MAQLDEIGMICQTVVQAARLSKAVQNRIDSKILLKNDQSPATVADYGVQSVICAFLKKYYPKDAILAEEHSFAIKRKENRDLARELVEVVGESLQESVDIDIICEWIDCDSACTNERTWILDPIDGTKGFIRGQQYAIALALKESDVLTLGILACPNIPYDQSHMGCLFVGQRGKGAKQHFLGDLSISKPITVSADGAGAEARFVESVEAAHVDHDHHKRLCEKLGIILEPIRLDSQAKYGIVARGEASAYLRVQNDPKYRQKVWDHAAGVVIVEEAGGIVCDINQSPLDFSHGPTLSDNLGVIVSNAAVHSQLFAALREN